MFASETVCVLMFLYFVFTLPRSPRWLAEKGRDEEALAVLTSVDGPEFAKIEMAAIKEQLSEEPGGWSEVFAPGMRFALLTGILLAFFNNWTGWSVIAGYIPDLFEKSGLEDRAMAILQFAMTYLFMGLMTVVSLVLMDRAGRRPLWMVASALAAIIMTITGAVFHFQWSGPIVFLVIILCTIPHGIALGGIPWLMMSELFPTRIRAKAVAVTTTILWCFIYFGAQLFPPISAFSKEMIGSVGGAFWLFAAICLLSLLFGWTIMPETKGKTLEEIAASWKSS